MRGIAKKQVTNQQPIEIKNDQIFLNVIINAKTRSLEITIKNARLIEGDLIVVTNSEPKEFPKLNNLGTNSEINYEKTQKWKVNADTILGKYEPKQKDDWIKTNLKFNYEESEKIDSKTECYSHWISYIDKDGNILSKSCIRAYPTWMNDMKDSIQNFNMKQIFIPGSHDAGSYRLNFNPEKDETVITKYSLTQDDNIKSQLMHGIRYLDIRMGYYAFTKDKFFMVHGITKQRPLKEALEQLKNFVIETNEIVIFDVRKFELGFQNIEVHRELIMYIESYIGEYLVDATHSWDITLNEIWNSGKNIILTYGDSSMRNEFPNILFNIVQHRWGNKDDWSSLEEYLRGLHGHLTASAQSDMAELTPNAWGIITDKYGGLRKMADDVNPKVYELYSKHLGFTTNILSVDFHRGIAVTELAIHFNRLRKHTQQ
ncbi:PI-PLC X domain-containing protein DDB_G0269228-like [Condylostylus longicornis]|uniref:PI-PLC X domain-containing protein DDB_G0269228-like n=1 Tax=Condylostylus longicornis TaxID=2530218 RepID=UPI00244E3E00|nr:PI-PLC X domain-containing protein DDB_G0269228-like [Condylostylus longicornis]